MRNFATPVLNLFITAGFFDLVCLLFGRPFALCYRTVVCPVCLFYLSPNGWMGQDATWYTEVGLIPSHIVYLDENPTPRPHKKGHSSPHSSAHVYCGETVAHLSNC